MGDSITLNLKTERNEFFKQALIIGLPVMLQNLISIGLNIVDSIMIGGLGEAALAAVGSANQVYMIYSEVCFGTFSGAAVYVAQFWGIRDQKTVRKVVGIDYMVAIVSAIFFMILIHFTAPFLISLFSNEPEVVSLGSEYMQITKYSYLLMGLSFCMSFNCRAMHKLTLPTIISAVALGINTFLNWVLIYGHFGAPAMGVIGAANATVIARAIELLAMIGCVYLQKDHPLRANLKELFGFDRALFKDVFQTFLPACATEVGWSVCMALVYVAYGKISYESLAVVQVAEVVTCFFQCIFFGLGNATSFIIGDCLGRAEEDRAYYYARLSVKLTWFLNFVMTVLLLLVRPFIIEFYNFEPATMELLYVSLTVWAFTITPKMLGYVMICGFLRSGGDTSFAFRIDFSMNVLQVGLSFFSVLVLGWDLPKAVALNACAEVVKVIVGYFRLYSKKWINVVTDVTYE